MASENARWEFMDYVWKPSGQVAITSAGSVSQAQALVARDEWWQRFRPAIMQDMQQYLAVGWEPITALGPDCWECKVYTEPVTEGWSKIGWLVYLVAVFVFAFIPLIVLVFNNAVYEIVSFRTQLRRQV